MHLVPRQQEKKLRLPMTTTALVSWVHLLPIQMPGSKSAWMDPPTSSTTPGCRSFANVAGTIQGENLSVDPVSGNVKIKLKTKLFSAMENPPPQLGWYWMVTGKQK